MKISSYWFKSLKYATPLNPLEFYKSNKFIFLKVRELIYDLAIYTTFSIENMLTNNWLSLSNIYIITIKEIISLPYMFSLRSCSLNVNDKEALAKTVSLLDQSEWSEEEINLWLLIYDSMFWVLLSNWKCWLYILIYKTSLNMLHIPEL